MNISCFESGYMLGAIRSPAFAAMRPDILVLLCAGFLVAAACLIALSFILSKKRGESAAPSEDRLSGAVKDEDTSDGNIAEASIAEDTANNNIAEAAADEDTANNNIAEVTADEDTANDNIAEASADDAAGSISEVSAGEDAVNDNIKEAAGERAADGIAQAAVYAAAVSGVAERYYDGAESNSGGKKAAGDGASAGLEKTRRVISYGVSEGAASPEAVSVSGESSYLAESGAYEETKEDAESRAEEEVQDSAELRAAEEIPERGDGAEPYRYGAANQKGDKEGMSEVVLDVQNLTKIYGKRKSVDNVSFQVYAGEVFGFLGPNGAGKTTTIRMISGLAKMSAGEIYIAGHSIKKNFKKAVSCIGGIIENPEMYRYMTGYDNMKYYASLYDGISEEDIWEVIKLVKMENRIHEKVKKYSLGMRQRVGIAQSLLHHPRILILDEPTNGLDPAGIHEMRDFLKMLAHERGYSVFISSHILTEMQLLCDRVGIIANGRLLAVKSMDEWTEALEGSVNLKMNVSDAEKAVSVIEEEFKIKPVANKSLINFTIPTELVPDVSPTLAAHGVSVLSMLAGEKSLEDTFLELTSKSGTDIK